MPHLSPEAVRAIHCGELYQWLQRCWWRAVQTGLTIDIVDEYNSRKTVTVPSWWQAEPWKRPKPGVQVYNDIKVSDDLRIKRIVLLYNESLSEPDIEDSTPQFWGVQLLRGQQWIETLGHETLGDYIPRDKRPGFRGFVEFDKGTERELRGAENPQHEHFDQRVAGVKALIAEIVQKVREFAEEQGLGDQASSHPAPASELDAATEFLRFLSPYARRDSGNGRGSSDSSQLKMDLPTADRWECDLRLDFPDPDSARVDWGQYLRNVEVQVRLDSPHESAYAKVSLELAYAADKAAVVPIESPELRLGEGDWIARFGEFQVITGKPTLGKLHCAQRGKYRLTARVESNGTQVARSSRSFYVGEDPPPRDRNPYTISISVENHTSPGQRRINSGDTIGVQISVTNHTPQPQRLDVDASLGDFLFANKQRVQADGTPPGATPVRVAGVQTQIVVNPAAQGLRQSVSLPPGKHPLRADLFLNDEVVAHASRTVYVEVDPVQPEVWPPFRIEQVTGEEHLPRWRFQKNNQDDWVLQYPPAYPLYRALDASPSRNGSRLSGVSTFVIDVCAEGIIEWVMEPLDGGDASRLEELLGGAPDAADPDRWEDYCEKMRELASLRRSREQVEVDKYGQLVRECAALSLSLFERSK